MERRGPGGDRHRVVGPTARGQPGLEGREIGPELELAGPHGARAAASTSGGPMVGSERRMRGFTHASILPEREGQEKRPVPSRVMLPRRSGLVIPATYRFRGRQPRGVATRLSPPASIGALPPRGQPMLRLQAPLPDRYTLAGPEQLRARIRAAKDELGSKLLILGHHYQRDEVIDWADLRGDSFKLARFAADNDEATDIVFCGVHFMAESADVLTGDHQRVILPDLNAGCSMADMANIDQVEEAWEELAAVTDVDRVVPITYMNSSAALKAFVGEHGGAVCTSSNARAVLEWALGRGDKVLFFPDQHLGRNTAHRRWATASPTCGVWNPHQDLGGLEDRDVKEATFLLWRGWCSVHQRFQPEHVDDVPGRAPRRRGDRAPGVLRTRWSRSRTRSAPPSASWTGSRRRPPAPRSASAPRSTWCSGWRASNPDKTIVSLDPLVCPCSTMFRIDAPHLAWVPRVTRRRATVVNQIIGRPATPPSGPGSRSSACSTSPDAARRWTRQGRLARPDDPARAREDQQARDGRRVRVLGGPREETRAAAAARPCARGAARRSAITFM